MKDPDAAVAESLSQIRMQVMWNRLISIVEEQAQTLIRSSFSTTVREAGDLSAGVFDTRGRMLAQAVTGTPGHVNSMATAMGHFLEAYPIDTMSPGDSFLTNDPWLTSGHLHDITVVTPAFLDGRPVALFAATIHVVDIGGRGLGVDGQQVFEEGICLPIMPLARKGVMNEDLLRILKANNREPVQVEGDLFSCAAAGEDGARRLVGMMAEFGIASLDSLAGYIIDNSRAAMLKVIRALPKGIFRNSMTLDGYEAPVTAVATMVISDEGIHVDYDGTSPPSKYGINVVMNYTTAYTCFGIRAAIAHDIPNNFGSMSVITVTAPKGSILNVDRPAPVAARHIVGHMTADVMVGCLHQAVTTGLPAESGNGWNPMLRGNHWYDDTKRIWEIYLFFSGGMGARPDKDGLSTTQFPAGIRIISMEAAEATSPLLFWRKEFLPDSGGPGRFRGGLGQVLEFASASNEPLGIQAMFDRVNHPARGRDGGLSGRAGQVLRTDTGAQLAAKGQHWVPAAGAFRLELPGGGGMGDPATRAIDRVASDLAEGLITPAAATGTYRVVLDATGAVDVAASEALRAAS